MLSESYEFRESTLRYDAVTDDYYLCVSTRTYDAGGEGDTDDPADTEHHDQTVLGIDLGVNSLAVASTGRLWQGDDYDHWINEFEKRRAKMQRCGTQAAHNAIQRLGRREDAWRKQYIHTVANEIVDEAVENDCDVIVFEELDDIRDRLPLAEWHHIWAFRRLYEYIAYKGPARGVSVKKSNHSIRASGVRNVGSRTTGTATASTSSACRVATVSMRTVTARKTSGYATPASRPTDPARGKSP